MGKTKQIDKPPFITIVIPVYNEGKFIESTIRQLLEQDYPANRFEIIVVDGLSEDNTREIVRRLSLEYSQITLMDNPGRRSSAGRNIGFKAGRGDYFVVIDGHCYIPDRQLLGNIVKCFLKSGADCLGRPQPLDPPGLTPFQQAVALARASRIGHGGDSLIYSDFEGFISPLSNGAVYRKNVFSRVGYVDENFDACEDVEFNYRVEQAGIKAYMSPALTVKYYPRENLRGLFSQMIRYGAGRYRLFRKHPETLTFNTLIPPLFTIFILAATIAVPVAISGWPHSFVWVFLLVVLMGYVIMVAIYSLHIYLRTEAAFCLYMPLIFFVIHFGLGWGFVREAVAGRSK